MSEVSPDFWRHYQSLLEDDLEDLLRDPDSDEEWVEATWNHILLVREIIKGLDPPL